MAMPSWFRLRTMPPLASSRVTYVRVCRFCRCWARARRVEVDAACMLAAGESQVGRRRSREILSAWGSEAGVTGMVRGRRTSAFRIVQQLPPYLPHRTGVHRELSSDHGRVKVATFDPTKAFFMVRPEACHSFTISKTIAVA